MKIATAILISLASASAPAQHSDFPDTEKSWRKAPEIFEAQALQRVVAGMGKSQVYRILGTPHFSEGISARRWVYWYGKKTETNCLLKVTFDRHAKVSTLAWNTASCDDDAQVTK